MSGVKKCALMIVEYDCGGGKKNKEKEFFFFQAEDGIRGISV